MDEYFFPGAPTYNRGRHLEMTLEQDEKWVFGLAQRDSLSCVLKQVPQRDVFILKTVCIIHYPVNHSANYVDPDTGHTYEQLRICGVI